MLDLEDGQDGRGDVDFVLARARGRGGRIADVVQGVVEHRKRVSRAVKQPSFLSSPRSPSTPRKEEERSGVFSPLDKTVMSIFAAALPGLDQSLGGSFAGAGAGGGDHSPLPSSATSLPSLSQARQAPVSRTANAGAPHHQQKHAKPIPALSECKTEDALRERYHGLVERLRDLEARQQQFRSAGSSLTQEERAALGHLKERYLEALREKDETQEMYLKVLRGTGRVPADLGAPASSPPPAAKNHQPPEPQQQPRRPAWTDPFVASTLPEVPSDSTTVSARPGLDLTASTPLWQQLLHHDFSQDRDAALANAQQVADLWRTRYEDQRTKATLLANELRIAQHAAATGGRPTTAAAAGRSLSPKALLQEEVSAWRERASAMETEVERIRARYEDPTVVRSNPEFIALTLELASARDEARRASEEAAQWREEHGRAAGEAAAKSAELVGLRGQLAGFMDDTEVNAMSVRRILAEVELLRAGRRGDHDKLATLELEVEEVRESRLAAEQTATALAAENERLKAALAATRDAQDHLVAGRSRARVAGAARAATALTSLRGLRGDLAELRREVTSTFSHLGHMVEAISPLLAREGELVHRLEVDNTALMERYKAELRERRALHEAMQELRGNIRVYARIRPLSADEARRAGETSAGRGFDPVAARAVSDREVQVTHPHTNRTTVIPLDGVFGPSSTQEEVFEDTKALMTSVLDGYHVCIFAYGPTGSGKTYTMEGPAGDPGVNARALAELFRLVEERRGEWEYAVRVSMFEIYNEALRDLLNSDQNAAARLDICHQPNGGPVVVSGLQAVVVTDAASVRRVMATGYANRATGSTNVNRHSSRSHCVLSVDVRGRNARAGLEMASAMHLVDLAGSERVSKTEATGDRLVEAMAINKSLAALGQVMHSIGQRAKHIPYRNSKLTDVLQNSLGGNSKTLMFVNVSPASASVGETLCSLQFAARVSQVALGKAKKNVQQLDQSSKRG